MKKNSIVYLGVVVTLLIAVFLGVKYKIINDKFEDNKVIYCLAEIDDVTKMEFYVDFKDGKAYRYTQVFTNKLNVEGLDTYREGILEENLKYKGITAKVWNDDKVRVTTEVFAIDEIVKEDTDDTMLKSIKEFKNMSRSEIIDAFNKDNEKLKCD